MNHQAVNPYLPSWEYVPDGEPHVFNDRVYVFGSHDKFNGHVFCLNDYICWSAPVDHLEDWRYEGVIYKKTQDPFNPDGAMCLYAPDVTQGKDGRYYLYYVLDKVSVVSVAVCDTPAGQYEFYGYVHYEDGTRLGDKEGDEPQFDPAVLTEGDTTYLYTGFSSAWDGRSGAMGTVLGEDMLTIKKAPVFVVPSVKFSKGTGFEGHEFFEGSSIRKVGERYYFVYSSVAMHELCYAVSDKPMEGFVYGGVVVSNCDEHIDTYKPAELKVNMPANNHGGIVKIKNQWYIFFHRHTNATWYSRQGCAEPIAIAEDGSIKQVEVTSCGLNGKPLEGKGEYPSYIACALFRKSHPYDRSFFNSARIMQDGSDGEKEPGYIANIQNTDVMGFKYFDMKKVKKLTISVRGYCNGEFVVKTALEGEELARIRVEYTNVWKDYTADVAMPDGKQALFFEYQGGGVADLKSFTLE